MSSPQLGEVRALRDFNPILNWRQLQFLNPVPYPLVCDLCGLVTRSPNLTRCRHLYCDGCVYRIPNGEPRRCPVDGMELDESDLRKLPTTASDELSRCRVLCPNAAHGCQYDGDLEWMHSHFTDCKFFPISCIKCGAIVPYDNIVYHRVYSCEFRLNNDSKVALDAVE